VTDRVDEIVANLTSRVLDEGHVVEYIPADAGSLIHQGQPYAYTVGRTLMGRPELLVTGMSLPAAKHVLDSLVRLDDVAALLPGTYARVESAGTALKMKLILADSAPLLHALVTFGLTRVDALQAIWPRAGGYPSENERWAEQPLHPLGRTPLIHRDPYGD
jgi:hypothetical protein